MHKLIDVEDMVGKTIKKCELFCGELYLVFEDETYIWFETEQEYDSQYITTGDKDSFKSIFVQFGIMTKEEYDKEEKFLADERNRCQKQNDLETLERLKRKYPNA